eukprot:11466715-Heterocapsa_arctica.AAC.1
MKGMGISAGDNHHSWMTTQELLHSTVGCTAEYTGLMEACRLPLIAIQNMNSQPDDRYPQPHLQLQHRDMPGE